MLQCGWLYNHVGNAHSLKAGDVQVDLFCFQDRNTFVVLLAFHLWSFELFGESIGLDSGMLCACWTGHHEKHLAYIYVRFTVRKKLCTPSPLLVSCMHAVTFNTHFTTTSYAACCNTGYI